MGCTGRHSIPSTSRRRRAGEGRTARLFCRHLDDLRRAFRHFRVIHVICDYAFNHRADKSKVVRKYLQVWGERVRIHFLPSTPRRRTRWRRCGGDCTRPSPETTDAGRCSS
jgi:hypothetical protein